MENIFERKGCLLVQKIGKNQKSDQGWEIIGKYDILTVGERKIALIGNKTKRIFEITPWKRH